MFAEPFWISLCGILLATYIIWYTYKLVRDKRKDSERILYVNNHDIFGDYDEELHYRPSASVSPVGWLSPYKSDPIREQLKGMQPLKYTLRVPQATTPPRDATRTPSRSD